jgi:P-type E1-E2 ATPase
VAAAGRRLGLAAEACLGGLGPEGKQEIVRRRAAAGATVVFVGDGVNDAAALAGAPVGVAMRGGAEASASAAGVTLLGEGLGGQVTLVEGAAERA